ncbi:MAG TPA: adenylate/guanylate cyclase domain-containing protein [Chitinophagaceae bacterium]
MKNKRITLLVLLIGLVTGSYAQSVTAEGAGNDTTEVNRLLQLSKEKLATSPDSTVQIALQAVALAEKLGFAKGHATALKNVGLGYFRQSKYPEALNYWTQSLKIFEELKDETGVANLLNNIAAVYNSNSDDVKALEYSLKSLQIAEKLGDKLRILSALSTVANIYYNKPQTKDTALNYLLRALPLCQEIGDKESFGIIAENIGEIYYEKNDDVKSLEYFNKSIEALGANNISSAFAYNGIGKLYRREGHMEEALKYHNLALSIGQKANAGSHIMQSLEEIGNLYAAKRDFPSALGFYKQSEALAVELNSKSTLKDLFEEMSDAYQQSGDYKNAYAYQRKLGDIKDSLFNETTEKKLGALRFEVDLEKKQGEINMLAKDNDLQAATIKRQNFAKNAFMIGLFLAFIIAFLVYRNYRMKVKSHKILDQQKNEIEQLLLNILPEKVAKELRQTGRAAPLHYDSVSVMFTDFKSFTIIADTMSPDELVAELDACFIAFDGIIGKYNLEKIKTIGDSYMCAGGIPSPDPQHVLKMVKAGIEIQEYVEEMNQRRAEKGLTPWKIRIGIHVGPVVAGVVGKKKYAYDIWGSTVNIASRLESNGEPGRVNISHATYEVIKDKYLCSPRGKISAKNIGEIDMYFIEHEIENGVHKPLNLTNLEELEVSN